VPHHQRPAPRRRRAPPAVRDDGRARAALRDLRRDQPEAEAAGDPVGPAEPVTARAGGFWTAVLVNLLNPNAWVFWSLVGGPILAGALRQAAPHPLAFLGGFYLAMTATNAATVLVFGAVGRLGPRAARALGGISAVAFLVLGLAQLWQAAAPY